MDTRNLVPFLVLTVLVMACGGARAEPETASTTGELEAQRCLEAEDSPQDLREGLPDAPTHEAVIAALEPLSEALSDCAEARTGVAIAQLCFRGDGTVERAAIDGPAVAGIEATSCMERALHAARLPEFGRPTFFVSFPYRMP